MQCIWMGIQVLGVFAGTTSLVWIPVLIVLTTDTD